MNHRMTEVVEIPFISMPIFVDTVVKQKALISILMEVVSP